MAANDKVLISLDEYTALLEDRKLLQRLFAAGVTQWEGYSEIDKERG